MRKRATSHCRRLSFVIFVVINTGNLTTLYQLVRRVIMYSEFAKMGKEVAVTYFKALSSEDETTTNSEFCSRRYVAL
jgi:hypothetical protein